MGESGARTHFRTCHLCEAMCGVAIEVDASEKITSIRGDEHDPFSRGHVCPKAAALADLHTDPDRLRQPMRRVGDKFEPISWDDALDEASARLHAIQDANGRSAVATYYGNPTAHNHGAAFFGIVLARALRTKNRFSATSVDQLPHHLASFYMLGHQLLLPVPDIDRTRHLLVMGANPLASNGSLMGSPDVKERLRAIQARGGRVVVLDPRRTETAELADEHVFVRPGTDALVMLAMLHVIFGERSAKLGHLADHVRGVPELKRVAADFAPERVGPATGVPAATIRRMALELADAERGVVYGRVGVSIQEFGGLCQWLVIALNVVTGNFDREGGSMLTLPAFDVMAASGIIGVGRGGHGRWKSRVRGLPESGGELPVAALAEDILEPGEGRIRALITVAGNPVLSTPNGAQVDRALASLDFMVSVDCYLNETTRHAHLILPPTSPLERSHYDAALAVVSIRNVAKWSPPLFARPAGSKDDWEILLALKKGIEQRRGAKSWAARAETALLERLGPDGVVDLGLRAGPYGMRRLSREAVSLARLRREPHGVDLGPLVPCLPGRLPREHRFIQLAPEPFVADVSRLRARLLDGPAPREGELLLIGRRHLRSNNSWMHNVPKLVAGKPRCTLIVHPDDARSRGIANGDTVTITSRVGRLEVPAEISDEIMLGVVSLPHGFGHGRAGVKLRTAADPKHAGVSANDLTDDQLVDTFAGTAALNGVPVMVSR